MSERKKRPLTTSNNLSPLEFSILGILIRANGKRLPSQKITEEIQKFNKTFTLQPVIARAIAKIREKTGGTKESSLIEATRKGYTINPNFQRKD